MNMLPMRMMPGSQTVRTMRVDQDDDFVYVYENDILKVKVIKTGKQTKVKKEVDYIKIGSLILIGVSYLALLLAALIT